MANNPEEQRTRGIEASGRAGASENTPELALSNTGKERGRTGRWTTLGLSSVNGAVLACITGVFILAGWRGLDYGDHPDEWYLFAGLDHSIENLVFMPQRYYYSGLYFTVGYMALAPELIETAAAFVSELRGRRPPRPFQVDYYRSLVDGQRSLKATIRCHSFKLRVRKLFVLLSALVVPLTFALLRALERPRVEALLGAGIVGLSWEVGYHSRYIAIDNLLMVFATVVAFCVVMAVRAAEWRAAMAWLRGAAIAVGFAAGCKVGGTLLGVPVLAAAVWLAWHAESNCMAAGLGQARMIRMFGFTVQVVMLTFIAFCITTPGFILDPVRLLTDWARGKWEYDAAGPDSPYYATLLGHALRTPAYFITAVASPYAIISIVFFACAMLGLWTMVKSLPLQAACLLLFPILYGGTLFSTRIMQVRNLMVLVPLFAVCSAWGAGTLYRRWTPVPWLRALCIGFLTGWIVLNCVWLFLGTVNVTEAWTHAVLPGWF